MAEKIFIQKKCTARSGGKVMGEGIATLFNLELPLEDLLPHVNKGHLKDANRQEISDTLNAARRVSQDINEMVAFIQEKNRAAYNDLKAMKDKFHLSWNDMKQTIKKIYVKSAA